MSGIGWGTVVSKMSWSQKTIDKLKDIASLGQAVSAIMAVSLAFTWFWVERNWEPKITISHEITYRKLSSSWKWVHVAVNVTNVSNRFVAIDKGAVVIQRILPLYPTIEKRLEENRNIVWVGDMEVDWPSIGKPLVSTKMLKLEPGENDKLYFEFQVPTSIETIKVQSQFILGGEKTWNHQSVHDVI
jgi:hypothetical protein